MNTPNPASSGRRPPHGVLYGCAMVLLLCACDAAESRKSLTQVAARVNGEEISIHQVNVVLSRVQGEPGTTPERLRQEVLDKLVDQQVLYAQAVEKKMDRDPQVMMLVDAARREIVARAYMDSLLAGQGKAAASEVHQYYVENPALFAQRKIYNLVEIILPARPDLLGPLSRMAAEGGRVQDIEKYLTAKGVAFRRTDGVRKAEQIPLDVLPRLAAVPDGKISVIESGKQYYLMHVLSSQTAPIAENEARPHIEIFLANQHAQRMIAQEIKRLKANARIEYLGDFSSTTTAGTGGPVAALKPERKTQ